MRKLHVSKMPTGGAQLPELGNEAATRADYLHAAVASVGHRNAVARRVKGDGTRPAELPASGSLLPKREGEFYRVVMRAAPVVIEHLDAVVARVGHGDQAAVRCKGDGARPAELPVA